jgi:hypothetical protein
MRSSRKQRVATNVRKCREELQIERGAAPLTLVFLNDVVDPNGTAPGKCASFEQRWNNTV